MEYVGILLFLLPSYLCNFIQVKSAGSYSLRSVTLSQDLLSSVPKVWLEMGTGTGYNLLQENLCLRELVSLNVFKSRLKVLEEDALGCRCFDQ